MFKPVPIKFTPMWEHKKISSYKITPKGGETYMFSLEEVAENTSPYLLSKLIKERQDLNKAFRKRPRLGSK
ncbi:MAG: hypothetical protein HOI53_03390 [Francisellaceae bacterium]|jgi:hypothetical protein|nr:hypothetical protein [Francisellaceae bacterium]MBT6207046.1 hypothetical protein [Francisellaceae bacterium]MBT6538078.1 hypothetical protein [Francisellaceae bacterium]